MCRIKKQRYLHPILPRIYIIGHIKVRRFEIPVQGYQDILMQNINILAGAYSCRKAALDIWRRHVSVADASTQQQYYNTDTFHYTSGFQSEINQIKFIRFYF